MESYVLTVPSIAGQITAVVDCLYTTILNCESTDGTLSVAELYIPPSGKSAPRLDCGQDAAAYVIEGRFTARQGDREFEVKAGDFLFVPAGGLNGFENTGMETARILLISLPEKAELPSLFVPAGGGRQKFEHTGQRLWCKAAVEDTHGAFSFFEAEVQPGSGLPVHTHQWEDETFYILGGRFELQRGDEVIDATPGTCLFGPRGVPHAFRCISDEPGRMIVVATPGGIEHLFADLDAVLKGLGPFLTVEALLKRHGIETLPTSN
jgi:mannose-6-phosphate isomerase-like protein (cupin superfamily)